MSDFLYIGDKPLIGTGTNSITAISGTINQIDVNQIANTVILSTPQDIATFSEPTFNQMTMNLYPSGLQNVVTVEYVLNVISNANFKGTARTLLKDASVVLSGLHTVDTIALNDSDIVLRNVPVTSGTTEFNGLYLTNEFGTWPRMITMDEWSEVNQATVIVTEGDQYAGTKWYANVPQSGTINVDPVSFIELTAAGDVGEAPYDNKTYGRKNGNWNQVYSTSEMAEPWVSIDTSAKDPAIEVSISVRFINGRTAVQMRGKVQPVADTDNAIPPNCIFGLIPDEYMPIMTNAYANDQANIVFPMGVSSFDIVREPLFCAIEKENRRLRLVNGTRGFLFNIEAQWSK